jgi:phosphoglycolate phosphatase
MGKRFDLLVFDWDGTVVDSAGHIAASLQAASADLELPVPSDQQARHIIGWA